jgi:hypothetical protein
MEWHEGGNPGDRAGRFDAQADYDTDGCITFVDYQTWYGFYLNQ